MDTLKQAAAQVGHKISHAKESGTSKPSVQKDAHKTTTQFDESDKVATSGRPDVTDAYGTHPKEHAASLVENLEKLGTKPTENQ